MLLARRLPKLSEMKPLVQKSRLVFDRQQNEDPGEYVAFLVEGIMLHTALHIEVDLSKPAALVECPWHSSWRPGRFSVALGFSLSLRPVGPRSSASWGSGF